MQTEREMDGRRFLEEEESMWERERCWTDEETEEIRQGRGFRFYALSLLLDQDPGRDEQQSFLSLHSFVSLPDDLRAGMSDTGLFYSISHNITKRTKAITAPSDKYFRCSSACEMVQNSAVK